MPDQELLDGLVSTYKSLNMNVRQIPEDKLRGSGGNSSAREAIRLLRDDELKFSQALKVRVTTGQPMPDVSAEAQGIIGTESEDDTTAALIAQFGTARESTLAMLRGLPEAEWDSTEAGAQTIRMIIRDRLANDQRSLQAITEPLGVR